MTSYFIRFTPFDDSKYSLQTLSAFFEAYTHVYVISYEQKERNNHYHICLWEVQRSPENLRYQMKTHLEGKIYISGKSIENKINAIAYTIKDGFYVSKNINAFDYIMANAMTHKKVSFDEDFKTLTDTFDPNYYDERWLVGGLLQLHINHNKKPYVQHIRAMKDLILLKKDNNYRFKMIDKIIGYD